MSWPSTTSPQIVLFPVSHGEVLSYLLEVVGFGCVFWPPVLAPGLAEGLGAPALPAFRISMCWIFTGSSGLLFPLSQTGPLVQALRAICFTSSTDAGSHCPKMV